MRRLVILGLLYAGMQLIEPLGTPGGVAQSLLSFGFLILAAYAAGELLAGFGLPKIVGYLVAGIAFGPFGLEVFTLSAAEQLDGVSELAIALIAFLAGAELRWQEIRDKGTALLRVLTSELLLTFLVLGAAIFFAAGWSPVFADLSSAERLVLALLFGAIAIVHSPAVTLGILAETGARSPLARNTLGLVLISDVAVVVVFSVVLAIARSIVAPLGGVGAASVWVIGWELGGALILGPLLGFAVALYLRFVRRELILFAILVSLLGLEIAALAHVELLLMMLLCGFVAENASKPHLGEELREAMHRAAAPVFVVFFCLSGAKVDAAAVLPMLPIVLPLAALRIGVLWMGVRIGTAWARLPAQGGRGLWAGLVSQAGVAIGLTAIVTDVYGELGARLAVLMLAFIAVNEIIGPVIFRSALRREERDSSRTPAEPRATGAPSPSPSPS